jgi:hypothetical protein
MNGCSWRCLLRCVDSYPGYLDMTGVATYDKFRSFQVRTEETVR